MTVANRVDPVALRLCRGRMGIRGGGLALIEGGGAVDTHRLVAPCGSVQIRNIGERKYLARVTLTGVEGTFRVVARHVP